MIAEKPSQKEASKGNNTQIRAALSRGAIMALITSTLMSTSLVSFNVFLQCDGTIGCFQEHFLTMWPRSFGLSFLLALPIVLFVAPRVMRRLIGNSSMAPKNAA
jgi:hypothetical protein